MNRLKDLRIEKGLLQSDIGKVINKSSRIVGFYEKGERDMSTETLSTLADFFNVSVDYLLGISDIRNPKIQNNDILELTKIGFNMDNYTPPTEKQKEQIRDLLEVILKDNKKDDKKSNK